MKLHTFNLLHLVMAHGHVCFYRHWGYTNDCLDDKELNKVANITKKMEPIKDNQFYYLQSDTHSNKGLLKVSNRPTHLMKYKYVSGVVLRLDDMLENKNSHLYFIKKGHFKSTTNTITPIPTQLQMDITWTLKNLACKFMNYF